MNDWDMLRTVLAVARGGTLSAAARVLGVNHATVSRQLVRAEAMAGQRLFDRLPSGLVPTAAGRVAMQGAEAVEAEVADLSRRLAAADPDAAGELRITVPPLLATCGLGADVAAFCRLHPGIAVTLLAGERTLNLHRREADLAIRIAEAPTESLWGRVVARQRAGWFATPDYLARYAAALAGDGAVPLVAFTGWGEPVPPAVLERHPGAEVAIRTDEMATALGLVRTGIGMLRLPLILASAEPGLIRVESLPLVDYPPVWALTHPDLRRVPRIAGFLRFIAERFAARAADFYG